MMLITHILIGGILGAIAGPAFVFTGFLGGFVPDLDLLRGQHRKTLHYPYYYSFATVSALVSFYVTGSQIWLHISVFLAAAALHSISDVFGGGLEARPWEKTDHRGVYSHFQQKWLETRHLVYDGSPGDFMMSSVAAGLLLLMGFEHIILGGFMAIAGGYTLIRKRIPNYFPDKPAPEIRKMIKLYILSIFKAG